MASTRTITGTILDEGGSAVGSGSVAFRLLSEAAVTSADAVIKQTETATTDGNGDFSVALAVPDSGSWLYGVTLPDGQYHQFTLASGSATTLHAILAAQAGATAGDADALETLITAHTADNDAHHALVTLAGGESALQLSTQELSLDQSALSITESQISDLAHDTNEYIIIACSDETSDLTTGTAKVTFRMPYAMTLTDVRASVTTAPVGSVLQMDINESGTTILSTKLTIDASEKTSATAATAAVISDSALADDAEITIDIDAVGSSTAGAGLKVTLIGTR